MSTLSEKRERVFISYSHLDDEFVKRLRQDLASAGISVWIDHEGLQPGTDKGKFIKLIFRHDALHWSIGTENTGVKHGQTG
jgi:hypothetical protein